MNSTLLPTIKHTSFPLPSPIRNITPPHPLQVEVCPALPEPLRYVRKLAYMSYQRLSLTEGPRKVQYTKVAVLKSVPKVRQKGDLDQGSFLKQYRDCGMQLSEGATEQVTVDDFLRAGTQQNRILHGQPAQVKPLSSNTCVRKWPTMSRVTSPSSFTSLCVTRPCHKL